MAADERRSMRFPLGLRCVLRPHDVVVEPFIGIIRNVSRQGCSLEVGDDVGSPADLLDIHFTIPPGTPAGVIVGEVIQRRKTPLGWTLGVAFRDVDPAVKWELLDLAYHHWQARLPSTARSDDVVVEKTRSQSP